MNLIDCVYMSFCESFKVNVASIPSSGLLCGVFYPSCVTLFFSTLTNFQFSWLCFFGDIISRNSILEDLFFFFIHVYLDILKSQIIKLFWQRLWRHFLKLAKMVILIWQTRKPTISLQRDIQLLRCLLGS